MNSVDDVLAEIQVGSYDYGAAFEALLAADKQDRDTLNAQLDRVNKLQQDLLHILEIDTINASKMMKIASQLKQVRIKRREIKDRIEEFDSVRNHLNSMKKDVSNATEKFKRTKLRLGSQKYLLREFKGYEVSNEERITKVRV